MTQDTGTDPHEITQALHDVVRAWETLPGGTFYSPAIIQDWLLHRMTPAISSARRALGVNPPTPRALPVFLDEMAVERGCSL